MNNLQIFEHKTKSRFKKDISLFLTILIFGVLLISDNLLAQGNLIIFPKRVIFEGNQRFHELNLANTGHDTARYVISFVQIRMKEDGGFENITTPDSGQYFADSFLRIFPRSVTLGPGESQLLKIQLTKTDQITQSEYRSHLYFRSVPDKAPLSLAATDTVKDTTAIGIRIVPVFGMTIPIIIRSGESTTIVKLTDLSFEMLNDSTAAVKMTINRAGNMSIYGDISVDYISKDGKITEIAKVQGIAVYTPNMIRRCLIQLNNVPGIDFHNGKLHLTYSAQREDRVSKIAEAELQLQ